MADDGQREGTRIDRGSSAASPPAGATGDGVPFKDISLLYLVNVALKHRIALVLLPVLTAFLVVAISLLLPRSYTSTASFTPQTDQAPASGLAGVASQFGISVPVGEVGQSPQFYADLLESRKLLQQTVLAEYEVDPDGSEGRSGDLVALLDVEADTRPRAVEGAIRTLRDVVGVSTDLETGVVKLSVTTRWPDLSRQVARRMLHLVNEFNLETRQTQAAAERRFIEEQLSQAKSALRAAEDSLETFLRHNRQYQSSPELRFEYDRLQQRVTLRQQLFTSLSESYQQARIDEVRNTPVITVVEPAELPATPDERRLPLRAVLGLLLGALLAGFWAFGSEAMMRSGERDPENYQEFVGLWSESKRELRSLWRRMRRSLP